MIELVEYVGPFVALFSILFLSSRRNASNHASVVEIWVMFAFVMCVSSGIFDIGFADRLKIYSVVSLSMSVAVTGLHGSAILAFGYALVSLSNGATLLSLHHYNALSAAIVDKKTYNIAVDYFYGTYADVKSVRSYLVTVGFIVQLVGIVKNDNDSIARRRKRASHIACEWRTGSLHHITYKYLARRKIEAQVKRVISDGK